MSYLDWLEKSLLAAVAGQRIGQVVSVRAIFQITADHGLLVPLAAQAVETASRWLASPAARIYAQGGVREGFVTVLAEFGGGKTAVVTVEGLRQEAPLALVLLIANHGTLRWDDAPQPLGAWDRHSRLASVIERALGSHRPQEISDAP